MKIFSIAFVLCGMFFLLSCDSNIKFENPNDPNNSTDDSVEAGTLGGECYRNMTCNEGLICDKEKNVCIEESGTKDNDTTDTGSVNNEDVDEDNTPCTEGTFKCHGAFVSHICRDSEWQFFKECAIDEICNSTTGMCETENPDSDPSDSGDSESNDPADSGDSESNDPADSGDTTQPECTGFSIEPDIKYEGVYYATITDNLLGDHSLQDQLIISFPENIAAVRIYDLASTSNKNYSTCTECVLVLEDVSSTDGKATRYYFQTSGALTIDEIDDAYGIKGTISAKFEEVTIDTVEDEDGGYLSTPVSNGKCVEIESGFFDNVCIPNCEGKICGDDGCGHECGNGCGTDLACSADQKECVPFECDKITLNQFERVKMTVPSYYEFQSTLTLNIGNSAQDFLSFLVYYGENMNMNKVWNLAGTDMKNCQLCLFFVEDNGNRLYFQQKGTVDFSREPDNSSNSNYFNPTDGTMNNITVKDLRLIESTIDTQNNIATPVPGGKCLEITNTVFNYTN